MIACGGGCGATATVIDAPESRPLLRLVAGIVSGLDLLLTRNWEFDAKARAWFCLYCRRRRRLIKPLH